MRRVRVLLLAALAAIGLGVAGFAPGAGATGPTSGTHLGLGVAVPPTPVTVSPTTTTTTTLWIYDHTHQNVTVSITARAVDPGRNGKASLVALGSKGSFTPFTATATPSTLTVPAGRLTAVPVTVTPVGHPSPSTYLLGWRVAAMTPLDVGGVSAQPVIGAIMDLSVPGPQHHRLVAHLTAPSLTFGDPTARLTATDRGGASVVAWGSLGTGSSPERLADTLYLPNLSRTTTAQVSGPGFWPFRIVDVHATLDWQATPRRIASTTLGAQVIEINVWWLVGIGALVLLLFLRWGWRRWARGSGRRHGPHTGCSPGSPCRRHPHRPGGPRPSEIQAEPKVDTHA